MRRRARDRWYNFKEISKKIKPFFQKGLDLMLELWYNISTSDEKAYFLRLKTSPDMRKAKNFRIPGGAVNES